MKPLFSTVVCLGILLAASGCSSRPSRTDLSVYAASSLSPVLEVLADAFQTLEPEHNIEFNVAGSQTLRSQIEQGAPADVFLSAHPDHVQALQAQTLLENITSFARNDLVLIMASPPAIQRFEDLVRIERLVLGTPEVPVGRYARSAIASQGTEFQQAVLGRVVSWEPNARMVLAKLSLGEADATLGYRSDALNSPDLTLIELPESALQTATYWAGIRTGTPLPEVAKRFQSHLQSPEIQQLLQARGFGSRP